MIDFFINGLMPAVDTLVLIYSLALIISYILMGFLAQYALSRYKRKNTSTDYNAILYSGSLEPGISVIASSYNESAWIVDCVRGLLALHYGNYELIVVNDGSIDDSFEKACKEFELEKIDYYVNARIPTKEIKGVYRSKNLAYPNLIFIDKENGGKADAMNAGLNISTKLYTVCVDVDSVMSSDALLKLAKPVTESKDRLVVSVGGVVHVANGCLFQNGVLVEKRVPKSYIAGAQVVEYLRAFLISRMAFGQINGLLLVSGALGIFRRDYLMEIGGYRSSSIGEDMEMLIRLRKYLYENKIKHKVEYIPEPLLWTEVPDSGKVLARQRTRWTRGLIDSLKLHKNVMFNPKYGVLGMVSFPYFVFFEWLAPFVEVAGFFYVLLLAVLGLIQWKMYAFLFLFMYLFGVSFSFIALFYGENTYQVYKKKSDIFRLFWISVTELFWYHPMLLFCEIKGNFMYWKGEKTWGNMNRKGLDKQ